MAAASSRSLTARFQAKDDVGLIHLAQNSKFSVVIIKDERFHPGMRVHLEFFLTNTDGEGDHQPLAATVTAVVQPDRTVVVILAFGSQGNEETACASYLGIQLPQRAAPAKGEHLSLQLVCVLRKCEANPDSQVVVVVVVADDATTTEHDWLGQVHLQLTSCWSDAVFTHSCNQFASNVREELPDFRTLATTFRLMQQRWTTPFNRADRHRKMFAARRHTSIARGKAVVADDDDDQKDEDDDEAVSRLTKKHVNEMLRLVLSHSQWVQGGEFPPQLISRFTFCGAGKSSVDKTASLWSVLETHIELTGRSLFVRRLFNAGQLFVLTPEDVIELPVKSLSTLQGVEGRPPIVHLFRVSRSLSSTPALVLEMMEIADGVARKVQPSPYVTVDQIVAANGDVYQAFARLESVHHDKLAALNPAHRLRPVLDDADDADDASADDDDVKSPLTLAGRQVGCELVGADDPLNIKLKQKQSMSVPLWWSSPLKPDPASFQSLHEDTLTTLKTPERIPPASPDATLLDSKSTPRTEDSDELVASS